MGRGRGGGRCDVGNGVVIASIGGCWEGMGLIRGEMIVIIDVVDGGIVVLDVAVDVIVVDVVVGRHGRWSTGRSGMHSCMTTVGHSVALRAGMSGGSG